MPSLGDGLGHHVDSYSYTNSSATSQCITVQLSSACTASNDVFSVAYLGAYNPASVQGNYLADIGMSPGQNGGTAGYSFNVPAGQSFTVTVYEVTANAGCGAYTLTVSGEILEKTPSRSRPDIGSFRTKTTVTNQNGDEVMTFISIVLIRRRPASGV